jgi:hypothetical protein
MSTDVSVVRAASIIRAMMEAARTSKTSVDIQLRTQQYIPEDSGLHTRRRQDITPVYSEHHTKPISKKAAIMTIKACGTYSYHWL